MQSPSLSSGLLAGFGVLLILNELPIITSALDTLLRHVGLGRLVTVG